MQNLTLQTMFAGIEGFLISAVHEGKLSAENYRYFKNRMFTCIEKANLSKDLYEKFIDEVETFLILISDFGNHPPSVSQVILVIKLLKQSFDLELVGSALIAASVVVNYVEFRPDKTAAINRNVCISLLELIERNHSTDEAPDLVNILDYGARNEGGLDEDYVQLLISKAARILSGQPNQSPIVNILDEIRDKLANAVQQAPILPSAQVQDLQPSAAPIQVPSQPTT
jgi:hypothetical protein